MSLINSTNVECLLYTRSWETVVNKTDKNHALISLRRPWGEGCACVHAKSLHLCLTLFLFLFLKLIYFNWRLITTSWWFWPYINMNQPWVYLCPPFWTPLPRPSPSHPSGLPQRTGLECPVSCIELGLVIYFTYSDIHFSAILSNHPTLAFSHRVQKSVLYICVSFAISHIESLLPSF